MEILWYLIFVHIKLKYQVLFVSFFFVDVSRIKLTLFFYITWHFWWDKRTGKDKHIKISNYMVKMAQVLVWRNKTLPDEFAVFEDRTGLLCLHWVAFPFWEREEIMVSPGPSNQQSVSPAGDVAAPPVIWFYFIHEPHPVIAHPKKKVSLITNRWNDGDGFILHQIFQKTPARYTPCITVHRQQSGDIVAVTTQNSAIFRRLLLTFTAASNSFRFTLVVIGLYSPRESQHTVGEQVQRSTLQWRNSPKIGHKKGNITTTERTETLFNVQPV